ncbi:MAG: DUF2330 domain-containing protein [Planctomycetota bacterium]
MQHTRPLVVLVSLLLATAGAGSAKATAIVSPGEQPVTVLEEEALVVWTPATKTEHIVLRAAFRTDAKSFGYLVATPTMPTIGEVSSGIFTTLDEAMRPPTHNREVWTPAPFSIFCLCLPPPREASPPRTPAAEVRVVDQRTAAGYDAVVLETDGASSLARWLRESGYASRPDLDEWLAPLVRDHWKIVAFRVVRPGPSPEVVTRTVRISFAAEKPIFPSREPPTASSEPLWSRRLRVVFAGDTRMGGMTGEGPDRRAWGGVTTYANVVSGLDLAAAVPAADLPRVPYLTASRTEERCGKWDDVWFLPDPRLVPELGLEKIVEQPRYWPLPLDVLWIGPVLLGWWSSRRRRKKAARG